MQAGQIILWRNVQTWTYPALATDDETLTTVITTANPNLVD